MSKCACCQEKDQIIEYLKDRIVDREEMCERWWKAADWWSSHQTGIRGMYKKPQFNHLKLVHSVKSDTGSTT